MEEYKRKGLYTKQLRKMERDTATYKVAGRNARKLSKSMRYLGKNKHSRKALCKI